MNDFELSLYGWHLTTAEITYYLPDAKSVLQLFIWQEHDRIPRLPRLNKFLRFWQASLDGPLHSVRIAVRGIITPTDLKMIGGEFRLN